MEILEIHVHIFWLCFHPYHALKNYIIAIANDFDVLPQSPGADL